jgi:hypothetical protein
MSKAIDRADKKVEIEEGFVKTCRSFLACASGPLALMMVCQFLK